MKITAIAWLSWFALFWILELPAARGLVPWKTLSEFVWWMEGKNRALPWIVIAGFLLLSLHLAVKKFN